jgi:hypothetical protein
MRTSTWLDCGCVAICTFVMKFYETDYCKDIVAESMVFSEKGLDSRDETYKAQNRARIFGLFLNSRNAEKQGVES